MIQFADVICSTLTHFHASPVLTVHGMVSAICWVQVFCPEVVSYESQVLGKNHAAAGLHQKTDNRRDAKLQTRECIKTPCKNQCYFQLEHRNVTSYMHLITNTNVIKRAYDISPLLDLHPSNLCQHSDHGGVSPPDPAKLTCKTARHKQVYPQQCHQDLREQNNNVRSSFSCSPIAASKAPLSYRGFMLNALAVC